MLTAVVLIGKPAPHVRRGIVSDWTHHHVLYPHSKNASVMARIQKDPRWVQDWYLRHTEVWWPELHCEPGVANDGIRGNRGTAGTPGLAPAHEAGCPAHPGGPGVTNDGKGRDWSVPLGTASFEPIIDFTFDITPDTGFGSLNVTNLGNGELLATAGSLVVTGGKDTGIYPLYLDPSGPKEVTSPSGYFNYDNVIYPSLAPAIDNGGLLFKLNSFEINIFTTNGQGNNPVQFYDNTGYNHTGEPFTLDVAPGGGQTYPAKYTFDVTATPSCANDFVVMGIPANPSSGGQANIIGLNNLYSNQGTPTLPCLTNGPTVMFAYASGTGQVPASVVLSQGGNQIAYIENRTSGSSYFHVLTLGNGNEGTSATAAAVPGTNGSNAVDQSVLLSPDGGVTTQSSTNSVFVVYTSAEANDVAYATTYSPVTSTGYLYKIGNVFKGSAVPTIVWSVRITAVPSTPVFDSVSSKVFFTDGNGRIDYVKDNGTTPSESDVIYGVVLASGATSENPVIVDSTHQMVYATFNTDGTNALVVQAPTSMATAVSAPVGAGSTTYTAPYTPAFNNAFYSGSGIPLLYVVGTGTGTIPTLYRVGFNGSGVMNPGADATTAALASDTADSSPLTEFYNNGKDYLFVGVTNNCIATGGGGSAGCVMSLDITDGLPSIDASTTAMAAAGGTSGIIVDNNSSLPEASSIYYATQAGATLVKATQSGLQ